MKVLNAGGMLQESQHGLHGFAPAPATTTPRRRARPPEDDTTSLVSSSTPATRHATRSRSSGRFVASSTTEDTAANSLSTSFAATAAAIDLADAECNICYNMRGPDEQRFCQQCRKMLCIVCIDRMTREAQMNYIICPFCNTQFMHDVIDLFSD